MEFKIRTWAVVPELSKDATKGLRVKFCSPLLFEFYLFRLKLSCTFHLLVTPKHHENVAVISSSITLFYQTLTGTSYRLQVTGYKHSLVLVTNTHWYQLQVTGYRLQVTGSLVLVTGILFQLRSQFYIAFGFEHGV